jgi:glycolate oxidase
LVDKELQRKFRNIVGPRGLLASPHDILPLYRDASRICASPSVVLQPHTTTQIAQIVGLAHQGHLPMTIQGAGTGLDSGAVATRGGLLLSLMKMNRIIEISPEDLVVVLQPGMVTGQINDHLKPLGLFYPMDPAGQSQGTIGGDVATAAHGLRGTKYGTIDNYVLGLEAVVLPGEVIRCGSKTLKCATGYHLTDLFIGSRGRIGVITEIILKLLPRPSVQSSLMAIFANMSQVQRVKAALRDRGIWPARLELMDARAATNGLVDFKLDLSPTQVLLMMELDGLESVVKKNTQEIMKLFAQEGGEQVCLAQDDRQTNHWWRARGQLLSNLVGKADLALLATIVVPESKMTLFFERVTAISMGTWEVVAIYGHLGEGRWHAVFQARKSDVAQRAVSRLINAISRMASLLGGRCLRPYVIGSVSQALPQPTGDLAQEKLWRALKAQFDPGGLFSPLE